MTNKWIKEMNDKLRARMKQLDKILGDHIDKLDTKLSGQVKEIKDELTKVETAINSLDTSVNDKLDKIDKQLEALRLEMQEWRKLVESAKRATKDVIKTVKTESRKFGTTAGNASLSTATNTFFGSTARSICQYNEVSETTQDIAEILTGSISGALVDMARSKMDNNWTTFSFFLLANSTFSILHRGLQYAGYDERESLRYAAVAKTFVNAMTGNTQGASEILGDLVGNGVGSELGNVMQKSTSSMVFKS